MVRPSCANSLRQTSGVQLGLSRIYRHSKAGSPYTGPSWKDVAMNLSTRARFQNHVRAFQRMICSGERTQRSVSSPPLPSRWAQSSEKFGRSQHGLRWGFYPVPERHMFILLVFLQVDRVFSGTPVSPQPCIFCRYLHGHCCGLLCLWIRFLRFVSGVSSHAHLFVPRLHQILTRSFENSRGPHEAEGLHPTWQQRG